MRYHIYVRQLRKTRLGRERVGCGRQDGEHHAENTMTSHLPPLEDGYMWYWWS